MTIEQLTEILETITGKDPISVSRRRELLTRIYNMMKGRRD